MKFNAAGSVGLFLSTLPSISALDLLPSHAPPEILAIAPNVTIMTPRVRNSGLEKQISFQLGSILGRQVVASTEINVARAEAAARAVIDGKLGCCPVGDTCTGPPTCQDSSSSLCPDQTFCCPTGYECYHDSAGNPNCRGPGPAKTKTNVAAIAGGAAGGVVTVVVLVLVIVFWRRRTTIKTSTTNTQPDYPSVPSNTDQHGVPPAPSSGEPFFRPMVQRQNLGVPYFNSTPAPGSPVLTAPSESNSTTDPHNGSYYSGLSEPQQSAMNAPTMHMPVPRYDPSHPRPLPMTVEHIQQPQTPIARPWSGFTRRSGVSQVPYAESSDSQPSGWTAPTGNEWPQARNASPLYASRYSPGSGTRRLPPEPPLRSPPLPEV
ncbi:hypothetical protein FRC06_005711 [Ceratobasidium sp. 370]|nr:hypothetical protein FRC06_005711 [Ceratobasidium sp. 370]